MAYVFISGATGYVGRRLAAELLRRGHGVRGLVRAGSENRLAPGCEAVAGNALDGSDFAGRVAPCDTFVQLVGVAHPSPAKAAEFRSIDLAAAHAGVAAALAAGVRHFIYVSVAHPAPVMQAYISTRMEAERALAASGLPATVLRPWYILGPGHWWPLALLPGYWVAEALPGTRASARRLGLVTIGQMVRALSHAVEEPARDRRILEVPDIRRA